MDGRARVLTAVLALACAGLLSACTPALAGKAGFAVGPDGEVLLVAASCGNGAPGSAVAGLAVDKIGVDSTGEPTRERIVRVKDLRPTPDLPVVVEVDIDLEPEAVYVVTGWDRGTLVRMSNNLYRTRATTESRSSS